MPITNELLTSIATTLCQYRRITRDMPSAEELQKAMPVAESIARRVLTSVETTRSLRIKELEKQLEQLKAR